MSRDRNQSGQYADGIDPETVADVFDARDDRARPVTAGDVVDQLGIARRTAHNKLNALVERGDLETRKIGARGRVWWRPIPRERERPSDAPERGGVSAGAGETPQPSDQSETRSATAHGDQSDPVGGAIDDALAALDASGGRRDAVRACVEYLREHGSAQKSDFVDDVYPDHTAGFASPGGWWNKIGKEYLNAVAGDVDAVNAPVKEGAHTWRFDRSSAGGGE